LAEAMACGLAPVVTSTPGPLEIVQDGHDGLVVPARDPQAIKHALERLITDRALLDKLRRNAHAKVQPYSWSQIAQQRLQLYEEFSPSRGLGN
jgi:glycosyltransferase involved in cell wall biosynthesis